MPKASLGVPKAVTPWRELCCGRAPAGTVIFALLEGVPVGLAHFEEAVDAQVLAIAAGESEALGAEKKFAVFRVVEEAIDAQGDGIAGGGGEPGVGNIQDLFAFRGERGFQFSPVEGFLAALGLIFGDQAGLLFGRDTGGGGEFSWPASVLDNASGLDAVEAEEELHVERETVEFEEVIAFEMESDGTIEQVGLDGDDLRVVEPGPQRGFLRAGGHVHPIDERGLLFGHVSPL
jgi:hypothetical protein